MINLSVVVSYLKRIDEAIADLRLGMRHANPYSVDTLRSAAVELEDIKMTILDGTLTSDKNLDKLLEKSRECIRQCIRPSYMGKPESLPMPKRQQWVPEYEVTVPGVNLIFVVDVSHSMFRSGGLEPGGRMRKILIDLSRKIEDQSKEFNIPCTVSLVWYADPTDRDGVNRPEFWEVALDNDSNVGKLTMAFDTVDSGAWADGADAPESGMSAIHHTLELVHNPSVENILILVSDEVQKLEGGSPGSHPRYKEVTFQEVLNKAINLGVANRFALFPISGEKNSQNIPFFRNVRDYDSILSAESLDDWVVWTLSPSKSL